MRPAILNRTTRKNGLNHFLHGLLGVETDDFIWDRRIFQKTAYYMLVLPSLQQ